MTLSLISLYYELGLQHEDSEDQKWKRKSLTEIKFRYRKSSLFLVNEISVLDTERNRSDLQFERTK